MKSLSEFIKESSTEEQVYVVKDKDGTIVNVCDSEEEANKIAEDYNAQNPDNNAKVSAENKSEYVK